MKCSKYKNYQVWETEYFFYCFQPSPWKKRRRKSISEESSPKGIVAMGSSNGKVTLYDTTTSSVTAQLNGHSGTVTAMTWSKNAGLFSASDDHHIIQWNLQENGVKCKWKSGKAKTVSLAVSPDEKSLLSGERVIKWWDVDTKQLIRTFTGHANQVTCLNTIKMTSGNNYVISGAYGDGYLSVWALDEVRFFFLNFLFPLVSQKKKFNCQNM